MSTSSITSVQIFIAQGDIVPVIGGGSTIGVRAGYSYVVDASGSYDDDYPTSQWFEVGLNFVWSCHQVSPKLTQQCGLQQDDSSNSSSLLVQGTDDNIGSSSVVGVTVFDSTRSSQTSVVLVVLTSGAPTLNIQTLLTGKINPSLALFISTDVTATSSGTWSWDVDDPNIDLSAVALTPVTQSFTSPADASIPFTTNLAISPNSLPLRSTLTLTLTCVLASGVTGSTAVTVRTNGPPLPGVFAITPPSGVEITDTFTFAASRWQDPGALLI